MDRIAVLIPCWNEALTIRKVVTDFKRELPEAVIYVYDNNSTDDTAAIAREAGEPSSERNTARARETSSVPCFVISMQNATS